MYVLVFLSLIAHYAAKVVTCWDYVMTSWAECCWPYIVKSHDVPHCWLRSVPSTMEFASCCVPHPDLFEEAGRWRAVTDWNPFPPLVSTAVATRVGKKKKEKYFLHRLIPVDGRDMFAAKLYHIANVSHTPTTRVIMRELPNKEVDLQEDPTGLIEQGIYLKGVGISGAVMNAIPPLAGSWQELNHIKSRLRGYRARRNQLRMGIEFSPLAGTMDYPVRSVLPVRILLYLQQLGVELSYGLLNFGAHDAILVDPIAMVLEWYGAKAWGAYYEYDGAICSTLRSNLQAYVGQLSQITVFCPFYVSADMKAITPWSRLRGASYAPSSNRLDIDVVKFDIEGPDCLVLMQVLQHADPKMIVMEVNNVPPPFAFCSDTRQCSLSWLVHRLGNLGPRGYGLYRWGGCNTIFLRKDLLHLLKRAKDGVAADKTRESWQRLGMDEFESFRHAPICAHGIRPDQVHRFFYPEFVDNTTDIVEEARRKLPLLQKEIKNHGESACFNQSFELYLVIGDGSAIYA